MPPRKKRAIALPPDAISAPPSSTPLPTTDPEPEPQQPQISLPPTLLTLQKSFEKLAIAATFWSARRYVNFTVKHAGISTDELAKIVTVAPGLVFGSFPSLFFINLALIQGNQ